MFIPRRKRAIGIFCNGQNGNELERRNTFAKLIQHQFTKKFPAIDKKNTTRKGFMLEKLITR